MRIPRSCAHMALLAVLAVGVGCPVPGGGPGARTGGQPVDPNACGRIDTTDTGRKVYAFMKASAELEAQVADLELSARGSCLAMGKELGLPPSALNGDTLQVCQGVAQAVREGLKAGLKAQAELHVFYKPAVCTVSMDAAASVSAECEGSASASANVMCRGTCRGTCNGQCVGTCAARAASGECAGACAGTCQGRCSGACEGTADVQGDATCQAAADVHADVTAVCTPPEVEVKYDAGYVLDAARFEATKRAIAKGLPGLLAVAAKLTGPVTAAMVTWTESVSDLYHSGSKLVGDLGAASVCVMGQIGAAFEAVARVEVQVDITVQASVEVGGACGAVAR